MATPIKLMVIVCVCVNVCIKHMRSGSTISCFCLHRLFNLKETTKNAENWAVYMHYIVPVKKIPPLNSSPRLKWRAVADILRQRRCSKLEKHMYVTKMTWRKRVSGHRTGCLARSGYRFSLVSYVWVVSTPLSLSSSSVFVST